MSNADKWRDAGKNLRKTASLSTVGLELGLSIAVGYLAGDWLDGRFGTAPYCMIGFVLLGSAAGFMALYRALKRARKDEDD